MASLLFAIGGLIFPVIAEGRAGGSSLWLEQDDFEDAFLCRGLPMTILPLLSPNRYKSV
jgi:hypothetical protein